MGIKAINEIIEEVSPYYASRKNKAKAGLLPYAPETEHKLVYDSSSETLEPLYFFIIDLMDNFGLPPEKLVDNFSSSPGSGHFAELGQRATIMQEQGTKILGNINTVIRSVLNIIYDLKEFRIRLQSYDDLKEKDKNKAEAAKLSLKQIWMDKVDIQKGNSAIKAMALGQAGFQTLIDAFLIAKDVKDVQKLDLNDRVKRLTTSRIAEFNVWLEHSEKELRKRYELEKNYLRSQVNSLKLYTRWAKPYLVAASKLSQKDFGRSADMVNVFNTLLLELTLLGKQKLKVKDEAIGENLPVEFQKESFLKTLKRDYYSCVLVDFRFRGIPQRMSGQPHYVFGGKAEIIFRAYVLNDDEIAKLEQTMDESDLSDALKLIEGSTIESMDQLQEEINFFLDEKDDYSTKSEDMSNPFSALIGSYNEKEKPKSQSADKETGEIIVKKDNWIEKEHLRSLAATKAKETAFKFFDIFKKVHGMASYT